VIVPVFIVGRTMDHAHHEFLIHIQMLLNGGMGVSSQLQQLNSLVIEQGRRCDDNDTDLTVVGGDGKGGTASADGLRTLSPKEAIVHLAQVQETARTGENTVSELSLGFGQGLSKRTRAVEGLDVRLQDAEEELAALRHDLEVHRRNRAKARWHWALESVTSSGGGVQDDTARGDGPFDAVRRWFRSALSGSPNLPNSPTAGWRPTDRFRHYLACRHENFYWAHKNSFRLGNIPKEVTVQDVQTAVARVLCDHGKCDSFDSACKSFFLAEISSSEKSWDAGLYFPSDVHSKLVEHQASKPFGIFVTDDSEQVPLIEDNTIRTKQQFDSAIVQYNISPTEKNRQRKKETKRNYEIAKAGLLIVREASPGSIHLHEAMQFRENVPGLSTELLNELRQRIDDCSRHISSLLTREAAQQKRVERMSVMFNGDSHVGSAFEILQALASGATEQTSCCICLCALGESDENNKESYGSAKVSMTKCGHLYCRGCLNNYLDHITDRRRMNCPSCRKPIAGKSEILFVDPEKSDEEKQRVDRLASLKIVAEAADMLATSNGQLSPHMWEHLYRSIELPSGSLMTLDARVSALAGHFLSHVRVCALDLVTDTGDPIMGKARDSVDRTIHPFTHSACLSSKVKALLKDLPKNERSVVFATTKSTIQHLSHVLKRVGIGFRALYTGQAVHETERSIDEWQRRDDTLVLLVQSGAAAAGTFMLCCCCCKPIL
jgi:Zinc finger, C3HC4 type (RING finger)